MAREGFRSLKQADGMWSPNKDANGDPREKGNDDDFKEGYYVANRTVKVDGKDRIIYEFNSEDGTAWSIWGSYMINEQMKSVKLGQYVLVQWLERRLKKASEKKSAKSLQNNDYVQIWDIQVHHTKKIDVGGTTTANESVQQDQRVSDPFVDAGAAMLEDAETDSLPFA